jgi:hypothetical protein
LEPGSRQPGVRNPNRDPTSSWRRTKKAALAAANGSA